MKPLIFLLLLLSFGETTHSKSQTIANNLVIHNSTPYFLDVEAPIAQTWIGCSDSDPKEDNSLMLVYIRNGQEMIEFHYRRVVSVSECLNDEKEYKKMTKGAKTIRIVGTHPRVEKGPQEPVGKRVPSHFTALSKINVLTFQRLQVGKNCKAFFEHHCDLPKNYWADTIPPK